MKRFWLTAALVLLLPCAALAQTFALPVAGGAVDVHTTELYDMNWLFLPAFADVDALFPEKEDLGGAWQTTDAGGEPLYVMQSQNLRSLFLFSADPENEGRAFIEERWKHANETTGRMALISPEGAVDHSDALRQLRGRGNSTWGNAKKPYQFKLENRADLLRTGDADERNRTWVLLADAWDQTLLRNKISLDLALELGMAETSHSEHVDLYYDGEYRGVYLLAEKVEVGTGRVEEMDYGKLLETWNEQIGQYDLDSLPAAQSANRYGNEIHYVEGLAETDDPSAGAYLLEMEGEGTLSDRSWFTLNGESIIGIKNPDNASQAMVTYVSEKLQEARLGLENDEPMEQYFDVNGFVRAALLYELAYSDSGYHYSSSFFVLPAGEERFRAGPVWDFDLAWRYYHNGTNDRGVGLKNWDDWMWEFYEDDAFRASAQQVFAQELFPMVRDILLGSEEGVYLRPLDEYAAHIEAAACMDSVLWPQQQYARGIYAQDWYSEVELLRSFIQERSAWMYSVMVENRDSLQLSLLAYYGYVDASLFFQPFPWNSGNAEIVHQEQLREADEENYALWRVEAVLYPYEGESFDGCTSVCVNGTPMQGQLQPDGSLRFAFTFEDPSYRPVDYYGEDIGMVYNYDVYVRNYPWLLEEFGDDREAVMNYFCDEGMYAGHMGNDFFSPSRILLYNPELNDIFGQDWHLYYWDFLYYGYHDGWLGNAEEYFRPEVQDAL